MIFKCEKCGYCCKNISINIAYSDIVKWLKLKRFDILDHVSYIESKKGFYFIETIRKPVLGCPFLKDNKCSIYDIRPQACEDFPLAHSIYRKCPAWKKCGFRVDRLDSEKVANIQRDDYRLAEEKKFLLIHFLFLARDRKTEEINKLLDPNDPDETLYCNSFDSTYTDWTNTGASPYLDAADSTNSVKTKTENALHG